MGIQDSDRLIELQQYTNTFPGYHFRADTGNFETAIEVIHIHEGVGIGIHLPVSKDWNESKKSGNLILCPDLLDFINKRIIEYEEETGNRRKGARLAKKGHGHPGDLANIRDTRRNSYYEKAGFKLLQIWESDQDWMKKIDQFLQ